MIFNQWAQVLDGTKTQTRRPVKEGELSWEAPRSAIRGVGTPKMALSSYLLDRGYIYTSVLLANQLLRWKWRVGRTYAVQPGRGKKAVGRTPPIKAIRGERLGAISAEDCRAEGIAERHFDITQSNGVVFWVDRYVCPICTRQHEWERDAYACLWNDIYGKGAWERMKDDDVWVLDFGSI